MSMTTSAVDGGENANSYGPAGTSVTDLPQTAFIQASGAAL
jgi:hypothetical protein